MNVSVKTKITAPADAVWAIVSDFNGLGKFVPLVEKSVQQGNGVGAIRTLTLPGNATTKERLDVLDEQARTLTYSIVGASPFSEYSSTMSVRSVGPTECEFEWSATFEPQGMSAEEAVARLEGFCGLGCSGLRQLFVG